MSKYKYLNVENIISNFKRKISTLHSGRVNSSILDTILVSCYGQKMHFNELATITIPEPSQLLITPFDKGIIDEMQKAILESNLGVNPVNDGAGLRLHFPPLTEENRKKKVKDLYKLMEESRIEIRIKRQEILKAYKKKKEDGEISENELVAFEQELQKETNNLNQEIEVLAKEKESELLKF